MVFKYKHDGSSKQVNQMDDEFRPQPCPKCGKPITAKVEPRLTKGPIDELMREEGSPFFQHVDVRYWCETENCGYRCHRTYKDGNLISQSCCVIKQPKPSQNNGAKI